MENVSIPERSTRSEHASSNTYAESPSTALSCETTEAGKLLSRMHTQLGQEGKALDKDVSKQGPIGVTLDFLKNNLGATASATPFASVGDFVKTGWSYVLDYDSGSVSAKEKLSGAKLSLDAAEVARKKCDADSFVSNVGSAVEKTFMGDLKLKTRDVADKYDSSQRRGVEVVGDVVALGVGVMGTTTGIGPLLRTAGTGAISKGVVKFLDGTYSRPVEDVVTGGLMTLTVPLGRYSSSVFESGMLNLAPTFKKTAFAYGQMMEGSLTTGAVSVSTKFADERADGVALTTAIVDAKNEFKHGMGLGLLMGLGIGAVSAPYRSRSGVANFYEREASTPTFLQNAAAHNEFRDMINTHVMAKKPSATALCEDVNGLMARSGLPPVNVKFNVKNELNDGKLFGGTEAAYSPVEASVILAGRGGLDDFALLPFRTVEARAASLAHEVTHHEQNYLMIRQAADDLNIGALKDLKNPSEVKMWAEDKELIMRKAKTNSSADLDVVASVQNTLYERYDMLVFPEAVANALVTRNGVRLTEAESVRAKNLMESEKNGYVSGKSNYKEYRAQLSEQEAWAVGSNVHENLVRGRHHFVTPKAVAASLTTHDGTPQNPDVAAK